MEMPVTLTTAVADGFTLRDTMACNRLVIWQAVSTGSMLFSGQAP